MLWTGDSFLQEQAMRPKEDWISSYPPNGLSQSQYDQVTLLWSQLSKWAKNEKKAEMCQRFFLEFYLYLDCYCLASVLKQASQSYFDYFKVEILSFSTLPQFSHFFFLRHCKVDLNLIEKSSIFLLFQNGCIGGITSMVHKYQETNSPSLAGFNPKKTIQNVIQLDKVSLFPSSSYKEPLPWGHFREFSPDETSAYFLSMQKDGIIDDWCDQFAFTKKLPSGLLLDMGLVFCCDLEIPKIYHTFFDCYIPIAEYRVISPDLLSEYQNRIMKEMKKKPEKQKRVLLSLLPKEKSIIHYRILKWLINHGIRITAVHTIVEFAQSCYMTEIVELVADKRRNANTKVEANAARACLNYVWGRCLLSAKKYLNAKVVYTKQAFDDQTSRFTFKSFSRFGDNVGVVTHSKRSYVAKNLVYVSFTILMNSKLSMCTLFFCKLRFLLQLSNWSCTLNYTDTDSANVLFKQHPTTKCRLNENLLIIPPFSDSNREPEAFFNRPPNAVSHARRSEKSMRRNGKKTKAPFPMNRRLLFSLL